MINATNTLKYPDLNTHSNILNLPDETWRDITGFEGYYQVSNLGRIKSLDRYVEYPNYIKRINWNYLNKIFNYDYIYFYFIFNYPFRIDFIFNEYLL